MTYSINKTTFFAAAFSLLSVFTASATPIPLHRQYQQIDGMSYYKLSLSSVGVVTAIAAWIVDSGRNVPAWLANSDIHRMLWLRQWSSHRTWLRGALLILVLKPKKDDVLSGL